MVLYHIHPIPPDVPLLHVKRGNILPSRYHSFLAAARIAAETTLFSPVQDQDQETLVIPLPWSNPVHLAAQG